MRWGREKNERAIRKAERAEAKRARRQHKANLRKQREAEAMQTKVDGLSAAAQADSKLFETIRRARFGGRFLDDALEALDDSPGSSRLISLASSARSVFAPETFSLNTFAQPAASSSAS
jgi:hypothetical protein